MLIAFSIQTLCSPVEACIVREQYFKIIECLKSKSIQFKRWTVPPQLKQYRSQDES